MTQEDFSIENEEDNHKEDIDRFNRAWEQIKNRCKDTPIEIKEDPTDEFTPFSIGFPAGRKKRWFGYESTDHSVLEKLITIPFEQYGFLGKYEAIYSISQSIIEATVRSLTHVPASIYLKRLAGIKSYKTKGDTFYKLELNNNDTNTKLTLGSPSEHLRIMLHEFERPRPQLSLKISGINITGHDMALKILESLAYSLFFSIDLIDNIPLALRRKFSVIRGILSHDNKVEQEIEFPLRSFDAEPMSLYFYARSAMGMPLLQFLAFYQVIEYYFHVYSLVEAKRKIGNIIKDPLFRSDRDADIGRIIDAMTIANRLGIPDERSQLKAVLNHCIDIKEFREFLSKDKSIIKYFSSGKGGPSKCTMHLESDKADLILEAANRIYDIRCKIVHTKNYVDDEDLKPLLPYSPEVESLYYDISLINYIAVKVLIAGSTKIEF